MKPIAMTVAAAMAGFLSVAASGAIAQESQAKSWNLVGETKERFTAKVVDMLCELAGDCVDNCGDGQRHLGLLKDDGTLVLANKNIQPIFSGAVVDLLPYCEKQVEVDGLMIGEGGPRLYQIQLIREVGDAEFKKTNQWSKQWNADNPDLTGVKGPWFRKDPLIKAQIEQDGYLGLGLEADKKFIEEWQ
ncbi:MAG: hypothetical protein AAGF59_00855 [Pseudomonadota bacterium]